MNKLKIIIDILMSRFDISTLKILVWECNDSAREIYEWHSIYAIQDKKFRLAKIGFNVTESVHTNFVN